MMQFSLRVLHLTRLYLVIFALAPFLTGCITEPRHAPKIGLIAPFSGRYREIGYQAIHGARLALSEFNAAGGFHGHPVVVVAFDDAGDPAAAIEQAHKLLTDHDIIAVIGHWLNDSTTAATPIYTNAGMPILATSTAPVNPKYGGELFFRLYPTDVALTGQLERTARLYDANSICQCDVIPGIEAIATMLAGSPGALVVGGPLWSLQEFVRIAGPSADSSYFITPAPHPLVAPEASGFLAQYRRLFPNIPIGWVSVHAYEATHVLLAALSDSPLPTSAHLAEALTRSNYSSRMLGEVRFTEHGEWQTPQYHVYRWKSDRRIFP